MGLFDFLFKNRPKTPAGQYEQIFKMLNGYTPKFTTWGGEIYESELIRSAINARATHISKLKVETQGAARPALQTKLSHGPNQFQTWSQFLYRLSTILDVHNTAFITPVYDQYGEPSGIYAPLPNRCEVTAYNNVPYLRYEFSNGNKAAIEFSYCGVLTKYQYKSDFFGESNHALFPTMDLIHIQNQGIEEGVKSAATYRFMAQLSNFSKAEDLKKERQRFTEENFSREANGGGLLLFPNTYSNIQQINAKPWVIDAEQMKIIRENVFEYFNVNEDILQGKAYGDAWSGFYELAIESFSIQFSEVMTRMLFTLREQAQGNRVMATANRLQYLSNTEKLNVSSQMLDRGIMSINDVREIWNLPPVDGGDVRIIRGEYWNADEKVTEETNNAE
ncbi:MAG: phage portal protein [Erysipelotrichaceae bacterium]|nr:phage portal protein [Erysipelotrichaceae bacterium]